MLRVAFNNAVHTTAEMRFRPSSTQMPMGNELRLFPRRGVLAFPLTRLHAQDLSFRTCEVSQHQNRHYVLILLIQNYRESYRNSVKVIGVLAFVET